jgi:hypothetical protein
MATECDHQIRPMAEGRSAGIVLRCRCGLRRVPRASREENQAYAEGQRLTRDLCLTRLTDPTDQRLLADLIRTVRLETKLEVTRELSAGFTR